MNMTVRNIKFDLVLVNIRVVSDARSQFSFFAWETIWLLRVTNIALSFHLSALCLLISYTVAL